MARLTWDDITERLFETGVKNCVLYVRKPDGSYNYGVAWNGLTAVTQSPEGAEPTDIFADDIKYLVLRSPENFKASIEAYTYPEEFLPCEGTAIPIPGVYIDQQPYQTFSICYRTAIGNDTDGDDHGYKIHIIYNCLAAPSEKDYGTIDDDPDAITFSWELDSIPMLVDGFKPTSALTIDSTKIDPIDLQAIEDALFGFGTDDIGGEPTLLMPNDIKRILEGSLLKNEEGFYIVFGNDRILINKGTSTDPSDSSPDSESTLPYALSDVIITGDGINTPYIVMSKYRTTHVVLEDLENILPKATPLKLTASLILTGNSSVNFSSRWNTPGGNGAAINQVDYTGARTYNITYKFTIPSDATNYDIMAERNCVTTDDIVELRNIVVSLDE